MRTRTHRHDLRPVRMGWNIPLWTRVFLTEDLKYQYIDFFTWYREVLTGEANIFYSFAQGLGSNTWGLYSYVPRKARSI